MVDNRGFREFAGKWDYSGITPERIHDPWFFFFAFLRSSTVRLLSRASRLRCLIFVSFILLFGILLILIHFITTTRQPITDE